MTLSASEMYISYSIETGFIKKYLLYLQMDNYFFPNRDHQRTAYWESDVANLQVLYSGKLEEARH